MQFSENWLRTMVDPKMTSDELAHLLTMSGLEVEEVEPVAPPFSNVVVGHVREMEAPERRPPERLPGRRRHRHLLNIVCGAPNVRPGLKVCAMAGAVLPPGADGKPFEIKVGQLRGVESQGMLCSAKELKLSEEGSGLLELPDDAPVGQNFRDYYALNDLKFTIKLTPNKADCLSVLGVAREVSALTGVALTRRPSAGGRQQRRKAAGENLGAGPVRPFLGPRDPQPERQGRHPGLDEAAPRAQRPALGIGAGGHLQLRDAGTGPSDPRVRPGQDPRRPGRALGPQGRIAQAAERQHHRDR
jgi:tRNA-binding EMAP/Myf-like protein